MVKKKLINNLNLKKDIILSDMSKTPKARLSFKLYEEKWQVVKLKDLTQQDSKKFINIIDEIQRLDNPLKALNRGKIGVNNKLANHELIEEIIHLGKAGNSFRLHGVFKSNIFYLICIDPNHKIHNK